QTSVAHARLAAGNPAAIGSAAFLGIPINDVGAGENLGARLDIDLALLLGHHFRNMVITLAQQIGAFAHTLRALVGGRCLPGCKALFGGGERGIEVAVTRMGKLRQRLAGRRIDHLLPTAALAVEPLAVDIKTKIGIHETLVVTRNRIAVGLALSEAR